MGGWSLRYVSFNDRSWIPAELSLGHFFFKLIFFRIPRQMTAWFRRRSTDMLILPLFWFPESPIQDRFTLPETNSSPLKIGHRKRKGVFQPSIFRCYVSFRESRSKDSLTLGWFRESHPQKKGISCQTSPMNGGWYGGEGGLNSHSQKIQHIRPKSTGVNYPAITPANNILVCFLKLLRVTPSGKAKKLASFSREVTYE